MKKFLGEREMNIHEFDLDWIKPTTSQYISGDPDKKGGSKVVIIGKPGTGKSTLIENIMFSKKHIIPVAQIHSGTEDSNSKFSNIVAPLFVFNTLNTTAIEKFIKRQKYAKQYLKNPWALLIIDDSTDDPKILSRPLFQGIFKNGRHWNWLFILSLQYCMDVKPGIRNAIDYTFILRETNLRSRKSLWENYAGCIPDFTDFCHLMDEITGDYTALVINNAVQSNNLEDCVFYYQINKDMGGQGFKFGCEDYWLYNDDRLETNSKLI